MRRLRLKRQHWAHVTRVSKCTDRTPGVNPHVNPGLRAIMTRSWRLTSSSNCATLVGDVDHGEAMHMLGRKHWEISALSTQFCIDPKTALKKLSLSETTTKELLFLSFTTQKEAITSGPQGRLGSSSPSSSPQNYKKKPKNQTCISLKKQHIPNCRAILENCLLLPKTNQSLYIIKQPAIIFKEILVPDHFLLFSGLSLCTKIVITLLKIVKIGNSTLNTQ